MKSREASLPTESWQNAVPPAYRQLNLDQDWQNIFSVMLITQKPKLLRLPCPTFTFLFFLKKSFFIETFRTLVKTFSPSYSSAIWNFTSDLQLQESSTITTTTKTKVWHPIESDLWQPEWNKISPLNPSSIW